MNDGDTLQLEVQVANPAEFLRNQTGTFEVISPYGEVFLATCSRGSRMYVRHISERKMIDEQGMMWTVRRVLRTDLTN